MSINRKQPRANTIRWRPERAASSPGQPDTSRRRDGTIHCYQSKTAASHTVRSTDDYESLEIISQRNNGRIDITVELACLEIEDEDKRDVEVEEKTVVGLPALSAHERRLLTQAQRARTEPVVGRSPQARQRRQRQRSARIMGTWMFGNTAAADVK